MTLWRLAPTHREPALAVPTLLVTRVQDGVTTSFGEHRGGIHSALTILIGQGMLPGDAVQTPEGLSVYTAPFRQAGNN